MSPGLLRLYSPRGLGNPVLGMPVDALQRADQVGTSDGIHNKVSFGLQAWRLIIAAAY
jgi:hypothetical protein